MDGAQLRWMRRTTPEGWCRVSASASALARSSQKKCGEKEKKSRAVLRSQHQGFLYISFCLSSHCYSRLSDSEELTLVTEFVS